MIPSTSLSAREARLLASWERKGRRAVTIEDIRRGVGDAAAEVASALVSKGVLERVQRGVYLVRHSGPAVGTAPHRVAGMMAGQRYYLGGNWALVHHELTELSVRTLDVFVERRLKTRRLGGMRVRFHVLEAGQFDYGIASAELDGALVSVSDPERTFLDSLDRPTVFGALDESVALLEQYLSVLDSKNLVAYAIRGSRPPTCQRLGALLDRHGIAVTHTRHLQARAAETRSLLSLLPGHPRRGSFNGKWNVLENDKGPLVSERALFAWQK